MIDEETKNLNYETFYKFLKKLIGEDSLNILIGYLGGKGKVKNATYAFSTDTGLAYDGSLLKTLLEIADKASIINEILPEDKRANKASIYKVAILSQLSKVQIFEKNTNQWEVEKRGFEYKYTDLIGALRIGERSLLLANASGIKFTEEEFEAMFVTDKMKEETNFSKYYSSPLTVVIKQAIELMHVENKPTNE